MEKWHMNKQKHKNYVIHGMLFFFDAKSNRAPNGMLAKTHNRIKQYDIFQTIYSD